MTSDSHESATQRDIRIQAIQDYAEWLENEDLDENSMEAAKRLGCIKGDVQWLIRDVAGDDDG